MVNHDEPELKRNRKRFYPQITRRGNAATKKQPWALPKAALCSAGGTSSPLFPLRMHESLVIKTLFREIERSVGRSAIRGTHLLDGWKKRTFEKSRFLQLFVQKNRSQEVARKIRHPPRPAPLDTHKYGFMVIGMKTTVDLPDNLLIEAKKRRLNFADP